MGASVSTAGRAELRRALGLISAGVAVLKSAEPGDGTLVPVRSLTVLSEAAAIVIATVEHGVPGFPSLDPGAPFTLWGTRIDGTERCHLECETVEVLTRPADTAFVGRVLTVRIEQSVQGGAPQARLDRLRFPQDDDVYARTRERMMNRVYPPGEVIASEDLAWELGAEQSAVLHALTRLAAEGYVRRVADLGYVVCQLDLPTVEETFDARLAIELGVIELSIDRASLTELGELRARFEKMAHLVVDGLVSDMGAYLEASGDFNEQLVALAGNDVLTAVFRELSARTYMTRPFGCAPDSARQLFAAQRDMLEAFERADVAAARAAAHQHCAAAKQRIRDILRHTGGRL
jgi:DNA-binding GntR family transcriptional regulator